MATAAPDTESEWSFLGDRILHVSRHMPARDGIARYADQLESAIGEARTYTRLGIPGGGGDRVVALWGWLRPLRLLGAARGHDDVLIEYHPSYFQMGPWVSRLVSYASLAVVARSTPASWVVHESDDPLPAEIGRRGRLQYRLEEWVRRRFWGRARRVVFHTDWERSEFAQRFPAKGRDECVVTHGSFFETRAGEVPRAEARERLGLAQDRTILVCIGFLSPHKGVDEVVRAVAEAEADGVELHVVGEPICDYPHVLAYVAELRDFVKRTPQATLHEGYVDDEEFDLWLRAADAVVLGYRRAASSSVAARARLLGTPMITTASGGIAEQLGEHDRRYSSTAALVAIIRGLTHPAAAPEET
jgi:glycosyltransferase involved in cell wall biosynthesis